MNQIPIHFGVLVSNAIDKKTFINTILSNESKGELGIYNGYTGMLFSDFAIADFIEQEHRYHTTKILNSENRPLHTFSSGERRKLYLEHCLAQNPDYIIFDNPFDHLDEQSRIDLSTQLIAISKDIGILQLANREEDLLAFIEHRAYVDGKKFTLSAIPQTNRSLHNPLATDFPKSLLSYDKVYRKIIVFNKIFVCYEDKTIIKNISWEINKGEFWQLIGPNGSGKSTLLSLITGENPKAYGQDIIIFDRKKGSGESVWDIKKRIGHFSTDLAELFKRNHTVEHMVLSGFFDSIGLYVKPSGMQLQKAKQWLEIINMIHLKDAYFNRLSLGQQRLVLIVRALIKQPPLLILDEPFEGLDEENTNLVTQLINALVENTEITIIYVSHTVEKRLVPSHIYELRPTPTGSVGRIKA